jgi:hypothetical protein
MLKTTPAAGATAADLYFIVNKCELLIQRLLARDRLNFKKKTLILQYSVV